VLLLIEATLHRSTEPGGKFGDIELCSLFGLSYARLSNEKAPMNTYDTYKLISTTASVASEIAMFQHANESNKSRYVKVYIPDLLSVLSHFEPKIKQYELQLDRNLPWPKAASLSPAVAAP